MTRTLCIATHGYPEFEDDLRGNFLRDLARRLSERNVRVVVSTPVTGRVNPSAAPIDLPGVEVHRFDWGGHGRLLAQRSLSSPADLFALVRLVREWRRELARLRNLYTFDGCLAAWALPAGFVAAPVFPSGPFMIWLLGSDVNRFRRGISRLPLKWALARATFVLAASRDLLDAAKALGAEKGDLHPALRLLPEGDPPGRRTPGPTRVLYIGRLEPVKGPDVLLGAFAALRTRNVDVRLRLVGDGMLAERLRSMVREYRLEGSVELLGFVPDDELVRQLEWSDCLVIPSRSEGMPLVFFEAVQRWKPIIASDVGDVRWYGDLLGSVQVVPPGEHEPLASALADFAHAPPPLVDPAKRARVLHIADTSRLCDRIIRELN